MSTGLTEKQIVPESDGTRYSQPGFIYADISYLNEHQVSNAIEGMRKEACNRFSDQPEVVKEINNSTVEINIPYNSSTGRTYKICYIHIEGGSALWNVLIGRKPNGDTYENQSETIRPQLIALNAENEQLAWNDVMAAKAKNPNNAALANAVRASVKYVPILFHKAIIKDPAEGESNSELIWRRAPKWVDCSFIRSHFIKFNTDDSIIEWQHPLTKEKITTSYPVVWTEPQGNTVDVHVLFSNRGGKRDALFALHMRTKYNWKNNTTGRFLFESENADEEDEEDEEEQVVDEDGFVKVTRKSKVSNKNRLPPEAVFMKVSSHYSSGGRRERPQIAPEESKIRDKPLSEITDKPLSEIRINSTSRGWKTSNQAPSTDEVTKTRDDGSFVY